jgi:hypothetical protein
MARQAAPLLMRMHTSFQLETVRTIYFKPRSPESDVLIDAIDGDAASVLSNADLYNNSPPTYAESTLEGERTVDTGALPETKSQTSEQHAEREPFAPTSPRAMSEYSDPPRPVTPLHVLQERARGNVPLAPTGPAPTLTHYLTEPANTVALIGARQCSILHDRPAIWLVKNQKMALSPLAAAVLTKEGLVNPRHLELSVPSTLYCPHFTYTSTAFPKIQELAATPPIPSPA